MHPSVYTCPMSPNHVLWLLSHAFMAASWRQALGSVHYSTVFYNHTLKPTGLSPGSATQQEHNRYSKPMHLSKWSLNGARLCLQCERRWWVPHCITTPGLLEIPSLAIYLQASFSRCCVTQTTYKMLINHSSKWNSVFTSSKSLSSDAGHFAPTCKKAARTICKMVSASEGRCNRKGNWF